MFLRTALAAALLAAVALPAEAAYIGTTPLLISNGSNTIINFNTAAVPTAANGGLQISTVDGGGGGLSIEAYGAAPGIITRQAGGTNASKTATTSTSSIGTFSGRGYDGTNYSSGARAIVGFYAAQLYTSSNQGTETRFYTTTNNTTTLTLRGKIENDGGWTWPDTVTGGSQGAGTINATGLFVAGAAVPLLAGTNTWSGPQTFGEVIGAVTTQSGTTYTLAATDCGTTVRYTSATSVTVTLPNSLPIGCHVANVQAAAGQVTFSPAAGATMNSAHSYTKTFGQYAGVGLAVMTNGGGTTAAYVLFGDGA